MREVEDAERQRRIQERALEKKEIETARAKIKAEIEKDKRERLAARGISASDQSRDTDQDPALQSEGDKAPVAMPAVVAEKVCGLEAKKKKRKNFANWLSIPRTLFCTRCARVSETLSKRCQLLNSNRTLMNFGALV